MPKLPIFNNQGTKRESSDVDLSLKDDILKHLVVSIQLSTTSNKY